MWVRIVALAVSTLVVAISGAVLGAMVSAAWAQGTSGGLWERIAPGAIVGFVAGLIFIAIIYRVFRGVGRDVGAIQREFPDSVIYRVTRKGDPFLASSSIRLLIAYGSGIEIWDVREARPISVHGWDEIGAWQIVPPKPIMRLRSPYLLRATFAGTVVTFTIHIPLVGSQVTPRPNKADLLAVISAIDSYRPESDGSIAS
jgi:hypothetical protein